MECAGYSFSDKVIVYRQLLQSMFHQIITAEINKEITPAISNHFRFFLYSSFVSVRPVAPAPAPNNATGMAAHTPQKSSLTMLFLIS